MLILLHTCYFVVSMRMRMLEIQILLLVLELLLHLNSLLGFLIVAARWKLLHEVTLSDSVLVLGCLKLLIKP